MNAGAIDKCMNFFHIKDTPYQKEFFEMQMPPFIELHNLKAEFKGRLASFKLHSTHSII